MKKGIIIGIIIAIIIGFGAIAVSDDNSESVNEISLDEEISEISLDEEIKNESKQFEVGLSESIAFSEG